MRGLSRDAIDSFFGTGTAETRTCNDMLSDVHYVQGEFDDPEGYRRLADTLVELDRTKRTGGNRIFYLATPPSLFPVIIERLGAAGLNEGGVAGTPDEHGENRGWVRVVIEKPFGSDLDERARAERRRARGLRRAAGLPHRPLPGQGDGAEHPGLPLRQRHLRADLEPALHRPRADHGRPRRSASRTAAATTKRPARCATWSRTTCCSCSRWSAMEPPVRLRRRRGARREGQGAARRCSPIPVERVDAVRRARPVRRRARSTASRCRLPPGDGRRARLDDRDLRRRRSSCIDNWRWQGVPFYVRTGKRLPRHVTEIAIQFKRAAAPAVRRDRVPGGRVPPNDLHHPDPARGGSRPEHRGQGARAGHSPAAGGHGLQLRLGASRSCPSALTRRCCSTAWSATRRCSTATTRSKRPGGS